MLRSSVHFVRIYPMNLCFRLPLAALFLFLFALTVQAQPAGVAHVTTVEGISEYRLDNGLQILLMPDASRPTATINVTYFVGSKHESYGETGMAHLLEHMLFYGTERHGDIKKEISERGGFANGTTWWERTNYFQTLPAGEENLAWAIRMEADRMVNSLIRAEDLESEMTVVRNEFEIGESSPFRVLWQRVMATAYEWHGYGRSTIGARSDIENVPIERLHEFYRKYYQPDNAMLVISGNFNVERTLALIAEHFGAIPAPERDLATQLWDTYTREPFQDGPREVTVRRAGTVPGVMVAFHVPAAPHPDFASVEALRFILGDSPSGRLYKALVEPGLASQVGAISFSLPEPSLLIAYAMLPADADIEAVRGELLASIDALFDQPPTEEEVRRASAALTSNMERALNDSNQVGIGLSEWAAVGDWRMLFLHRDRLEQIDAEQVREVARRYLLRDNRTVGTFIPDSEPQRVTIADAPEVGELLAGYTGREGRAEGEDFEATPDNIESRVVRFELANGARVALLPKATRGEAVRANLQLRLGNEASLTGVGHIPSLTASMLDRGSENYSRQAIRDRLDSLQSAVSVGGSVVVSAAIESRRDSLEEVLDLIEELLVRPVFPENELEELRRQMLTQLDQQRDDPGAVAINLLSRHFNVHGPDHPDYAPDFDETEARIRAVTRDDLVEFHRAHYGFGVGSTLAFVGDFDAGQLRASLERRFGTWNQATDFVRTDTPFVEIAPARLEAQLDDKANAFLLARQNFEMRDDHPDFPALRMAGHLLGGGFLSSRLGNRIRNQEGLSYGVGGGFSAHPIDTVGGFNGFAAFAPENRERLEEVFMEELEKAAAGGFNDDELESSRTGLLQQLALIRSDDGRLAGVLATGLYLGRDLYYDADLEARIAALSLDEVNQAVARWLKPERVTFSTAGDFSGAAAR